VKEGFSEKEFNRPRFSFDLYCISNVST